MRSTFVAHATISARALASVRESAHALVYVCAPARALAIALILSSLLVTTPAMTQADPWHPTPGTTWQWQQEGTVNTSYDVQMYVLDLFDTPIAVIDELHTAGRMVIASFSAGTYESWRPDEGAYPPQILGDTVDGWAGERWVDIRALATLGPILEARMDLAVSKGFDGIVPGNIDPWLKATGFPLNANDQLNFNLYLATQAHARDLSIGLRNNLDQVSDLHSSFDWGLGEECYRWSTQDLLLPFVQSGKAVFGVEYQGDPEVYCPILSSLGYSWLTKTYSLGDEPPNACESVTAIGPTSRTMPRLHAAMPNPFNPSTTITYFVPQAGVVELAIYDSAGRKVSALVSGQVGDGEHRIHWNGQDSSGNRVASGIYHYRLRVGDFVESRRMVLLK